jgi:hypothetical protein
MGLGEGVGCRGEKDSGKGDSQMQDATIDASRGNAIFSF